MLTLNDIDALTPEQHSGSVYSDLYKDVYGSRPRHSQFRDLQDFDQQFQRLVQELIEEQRWEQIRQADAREVLEDRIKDLKDLGARDTQQAIRWIADAEGISDEDIACYGWDIMDHRLNLKLGTVGAIVNNKDTAQ